MTRRALVQCLAVLAPPVLRTVVGPPSCSFGNQEELGRTVSVLYPFWAAALAATGLGLLLAGPPSVPPPGWPSPPTTPPVSASWSGASCGPFRWGRTCSVGSSTPPPGPGSSWPPWPGSPSSSSGVWILGPWRLFFAASRSFSCLRGDRLRGSLDQSPLPPPRDVVAEAGQGGDPRRPNVYHFILESFQDELFDSHLPPGGAEALAGFVRFRATSRSHATSVALPAILTGRWQPMPGMADRTREALTGKESRASPACGRRDSGPWRSCPATSTRVTPPHST